MIVCIFGSFIKRFKSFLMPQSLSSVTFKCKKQVPFQTKYAFKVGVVHPIHKSGDRDRISNYRPISLLPTLSKILEMLINTRLTNSLESNQLLSHYQYFFRSGISPTNAVLGLTNYILNKLDNKQNIYWLIPGHHQSF